jgi:transketolase
LSQSLKQPAYLRLGLGKSYPQIKTIADMNQVIGADNSKVTIIALGPIVHNVLEAITDRDDIDVFTILKIPFIDLVNELKESIKKTGKVIVVEEHVERGGLAESLLSNFARNAIMPEIFVSMHAKGYPSKLYGNQSFHQTDSGLDVESIKNKIKQLV